jgi:hypothetical protein
MMNGGLQRLVLGIAGLLDQLLGGGEIVFDVEGRLAKPGARRIDLALGGLGQAVHQPDHGVAVDGEIERLAQRMSVQGEPGNTLR